MPALERMLAKESVCEHVFFGPNTPEQTRNFFRPYVEETQQALSRQRYPQSHVLCIRRDGDFVGNGALITDPYDPTHFTLGYNLDEPFWGCGIGTRVCAFLVEYGFRRLGARRLSADCMSTNRGSQRVLEKNGFSPEGRRPGYWNKNGRPADDLLFGLLRTTWEQRAG